MRRLALLLSICCGPLFSQVTITDTIISSPDGGRFTGTVDIYLKTPIVNNGQSYGPLHKTVTVTNGAFTTALIPNDASTPSGTVYYVTYFGTSSWHEYWYVPTVSTVLSIGAVRIPGQPPTDNSVLIYQLAQSNAQIGQTLIWSGYSWLPGTVAALSLPGFSGGDITSAPGSTVLSIGPSRVTNAMLAGSIASSKLVGTDIATLGTISAGTWQSVKIGLAYGGTNSDLSATGGAHQVLQQSTVGGPVSVGQLAAVDISGLATSAVVDATNAGNITSGIMPNARLLAVPNSALANSAITVNTTAPLTGGAAPSLGGSLTVACATCEVTGNKDAASGYAGLTAGSLLKAAEFPAVTGDTTIASGTTVSTTATVGGSSAANIHAAELLANAATALNTPSAIVKRDASGNFAAGTITASLTGQASLNEVPLTFGSGLSRSANAVSVPPTGIANSMLVNPSLTVTAGTGLTGGGIVALGSSVSVAMPAVGTAGTYTKITTDAQGRVLSGTSATTGDIGAVPVGRLLSTTAPLAGGGDLSADRTLSMPASTSLVDGYLSHLDWSTFNGKQAALGFTPLNPANNLSEVTAATARTNLGLGTAATAAATSFENPLTFTAPMIRSTNTITCQTATGSLPGCLSAADWSTFNGKQPAGSYLTSAITSLNGLNGATQTFTDDTNVKIVSGGIAHVITWSGSLAKGRQHAATAYTDQANTYSGAFVQDFSAISHIRIPAAAGYAPSSTGHFGYDSTANAYKGWNGTAIKTFAFLDSNITGNAATATALAATPTKCSAGNYPLGVDALGNAVNCTSASSGSVTGSSLTSGNVITGAGGSTIQDSGKTAPSGAFVGTTDTQTLSAKTVKDAILQQTANSDDMLSGSRITDTSPTGNFLNFKSLAGTSLFQVDVAGVLQAGSVPGARVSGNIPGNAAGITGYSFAGSGLKLLTGTGSYTNGNAVQVDAGGNVIDAGIAVSNILLSTGSYPNPSWLTALAWSKITGAPGIISSLNTLTAGTQTFSVANDTNVNLSIGSATSTHTFTLSWAGALAKVRQHVATVYSDQANTYVNQSAPATPASGNTAIWTDSTDKNLKAKNDAGTISVTVQPTSAVSHQFATAISSAGVVSQAQPAASDITGLAASATIDTTNAGNITSGTLPNARLATVPNSALANSAVTVTAGTNMTGGGSVALGSSITLNSPNSAQTNASNTFTAGTQDFSGAAHTIPAKVGTVAAIPATCTVGEQYFASDATAGRNKYYCTATNTWTQTLSAPVSSVFTRTGAITAATGDYTAAQVTNAVDSTASYSNPAWITSLAGGKITGNIAGNAGTATTATSFSGSLAGDATGTQSATLVKQIHDNVTSVNFAASPYTLVSTDSYIYCDAAGGAVVLNLPATSGSGREVAIKKIDSSANACTPTRNGTDLIDGATTVPITNQFAAIKILDRAAGTWDRMHINQLGGDVTGISSANTVSKLNNVLLSGLATGILKNTTGTGAPSIAVAGDFPVLNQNTTGTAVNITGVAAVANGGTGTGSTLTGLVRGSGSAMTAAELSGDATTSGSNVVTVGKINGVAISGTPAAGNVPIASSSTAAAWGTPTAAVGVQNNGTLVGTRAVVNLIPTAGLTNTITDTGSLISVQQGIDTAVVATRAGVQSGQSVLCAPASASGTTYTCSLSPSLTAYASGMQLVFRPDVNGTGGAMTLNVDGLGAKGIKRADGSTNPTAAEIVANLQVPLIYDGTNFRLPGGPVALGTGSIFTIPMYQEYIAAICQNTSASIGLSTPTSNAPTAVCITGTNTQLGAAEFTATGQTVQGRFTLPEDWVSGASNDLIIRFRSVGITGNTVWNLQTACIANTGALVDPSWNTAQTASVAAQGTTLFDNTVTLSTITFTGCSAGNLFFWKMGLDASTTTTGNQDLLSVRFKLKRTIATL